MRVFGRSQPAADRAGPSVERRALLEGPTERLDDLAELGLVELLAVAGAGRPRDVLVHERAAEVVGARSEGLAGAVDTHLHPRDLDVVDPSAVRDAGDGVDEQRLAERRAGPGPVLEEDRGRHVHERERHELGEPARLLLQVARPHEVAGDVDRALDVPEHDRDVRPEPDRMRDAVGLEPFVRRDLVGADDGAHLVVEDLGRGAREGGESGVLRFEEIVTQRHAEPARALGHLERGEAVHVDLGRDLFHGPGDGDVVVAVEVGMDAALQADLRRAALDGLDDAPLNLGVVEQVGRPAEVERQWSLRERAEAALERAHVRVVDVAVAHERDDVTDGVAPEVVRDLADASEVRTAGGEECHELVDADLVTGRDPGQHLVDRAAAAEPARPRGGDRAGARFRPRDQRVFPPQPLGVRAQEHGEAHVGVEPAFGVARRTPGRR